MSTSTSRNKPIKSAEPAIPTEPLKKRSRPSAKNPRKKGIPPPATIYASEATEAQDTSSALSSLPDHCIHSTRGRHPIDPVFQPSDDSSSNHSDEDNEGDEDEDDVYKDSVANNGLDGYTESMDQSQHGRLAENLALEIPTISIVEPSTTTSPPAQSASASAPSVSDTMAGPGTLITANGGSGSDGEELPHGTAALVDSDSKWPKDTDIRYPLKHNGHINMNDQSSRVQDVCRQAIPHAWSLFCTKYALPTEKDSRAWLRDALTAAAQELGDTDMEDRIRSSDDYARILCDVSLNRSESWRTRLANIAFKLVQSQYNLTTGNPAILKDELDKLLHFDGSYKYCFTFVDWDSQPRVADMTKPYLLPISSEVTRACFKLGRGSYLKKTQSCFKDTDGEYQMPQALLALSVTLVHAALDFLRKGIKRGKGMPLQCVTYHDAYTAHLGVLEDLKTKEATSRAYPMLMRKLYRMAAGIETRQPQSSLPAVIKTNIEHLTVD